MTPDIVIALVALAISLAAMGYHLWAYHQIKTLPRRIEQWKRESGNDR